ncbi:MAG: sugar phosphate isomerase/epimerase, partial [Planctomycetes bacterium]|nr:sugar phosphate isomerase/epimerase [Planctomycetota bacterium]
KRAKRKPLQKSLIVDKIDKETLGQHKAAGFDGVECKAWDVKPAEAAEARKIAESCQMRIHSVMRGWAGFNDPAAFDKEVESIRTALAAAQAYGADAILLVPCRLKKMPMPQPWEFDIDFDKKTGHLERVVNGDNAPYRQYIAAHNAATDASRKALKILAADAEKAGVIIAVENVWNNLWVKPDLAANFVRSIDSPWVQYYFDIGNHVKYAPPQDWIDALGKLIVKVHVKDFLLNPDSHGGKFVDIRDGSVNWPTVRKKLDKIGYKGWMTIEGSGKLTLEEKSNRLDLIIAGK